MVRKPLKKTAPPPKRAEPGVYLFVRVSPDAVQVLKADRVPDAPREPLRAPLPANDVIPQFEDVVPELMLTAIHDDGTIAESFGWPADPEWFVETDREQRLVSSQLQALSVWEARWRIPLSDAVRYLQFSRNDLAWSAGRASARKQTSLG